MPKATSKKQQMAAGAALAAKRGERSKSSLKGASRQMASSMNEEELHDMASVKRKKLPKRSSSRSSNSSSSKTSKSRSGSGSRTRTSSRSGSKSTSRKSTSRKSTSGRRSTKSGSRSKR